MAKLNDVARKAGVSLTTASMALSGKGRISETVRRQVQAAADELGYKRPRHAEFRQWVLLMNMEKESDGLGHFLNPLIRELMRGSSENGYNLTILPVSYSNPDIEILESIKTARASAVLSIHFTSESIFRRLEEEGIPCVIINSTALQHSFFTVCVDDFMGAYEGTLQLIRHGHRQIGFLDYYREKSPGIMADRYFGFRKAVEEYGLKHGESDRMTVELSDYEELRAALESFLSRGADRPTGLFLHDDRLGNKVIHLLNRLSVSVPEELSLIAPGDTLDYQEKETCRLSTMRIDTELMGRYAVNMLLERIRKGEQAPHLIKIRQTYTDRATIVPPKT